MKKPKLSLSLGKDTDDEEISQDELDNKNHKGPLGRKFAHLTLNIPVKTIETKGENEKEQRQKKFDFFDQQCSEIFPFLYLGSKTAASNLALLKEKGITHVINCAGGVYPNYHRDYFHYLTLNLTDDPSEDLLPVFPFVCCVIEAIRQTSPIPWSLPSITSQRMSQLSEKLINSSADVKQPLAEVASKPHKIFIHCHQGVSRAPTVVMAYVMWSCMVDFDASYEYVRARRGIVRPNYGFVCQLQDWGERLREGGSNPLLLSVSAQHLTNPKEMNIWAVTGGKSSKKGKNEGLLFCLFIY